MATDKLTYREIFSVLLLRMLPVLILITLAYRAARREIPAIAAIPVRFNDDVFLVLIVAADYLTAGKLVMRLLRDGKSGSSGSNGAA